MYNEQNFVSAIEESFHQYKLCGARSTAKLKPIHKFVADTLSVIWGNDYEIRYMKEGGGEVKVIGKYYPKDIDITVMCNGKAIFCLGVKFVTFNYKQNANNYFENMMGETANIQAIGSLPYAQLLILRHQPPYYPKNETEKPSKIETINDKDISKYLKLVFDTKQAHRPEYLGIQLIDIDESNGKVGLTDLEKSFSEDVAVLLKTKLSLKTFFDEIAMYKNYLATH